VPVQPTKFDVYVTFRQHGIECCWVVECKRTVRLNETRTALVYRYSDQQGAPPVYAFPNGDQPQHLLSYAGRVFVANWETGKMERSR
jgi:hypothetical protein